MNNNLNNDFFNGTNNNINNNNNESNNTNNQPSLTDFFGVPQSSSQNNFSNNTNKNNNNNNNNINEVNINNNSSNYNDNIFINGNFQNNNFGQNNINNSQNVMVNNTVNKSSSNGNIIIVIIVILVIGIVGVNVFINKLSNTGNEVIEDADYDSFGCIGSSCSMTFSNEGNSKKYKIDEKYYDMIVLLKRYNKYIKLNLYHNNKKITDYKIILRSNGNEIDKVSNEEELRKAIGLYGIGTYTDTFSLKSIGNNSFYFGDDGSYTFDNYIFVDKNGNECEMKYINTNGSLSLNIGNSYTITFEVKKNSADIYEYIIKNVV